MTVIEYKNYGKCIRIEKGGILALITIDVGPRIIYYGTESMNFLNEDLERNVSKGGQYFDENFGIGEKWYLYGGHRVWKSPEDLESYTTDNCAVEYKLRTCGGTFTTRVAKKLDFSLDVEMTESGSLTVKNIITNKADIPRELSVWSLTVVARGGVLVVPLNDPHDDLNPYQNLVQWPYNDIADERVFFGKRYLTVAQTNKENPLKLGLFSEKGRAYYVLGDNALIFNYPHKNVGFKDNDKSQDVDFPHTNEGFDDDNKLGNVDCYQKDEVFDGRNKFQIVDYPRENRVFGDFWCNMETYTNAHILEVESLTPKVLLLHGQSAMLTEHWAIAQNVSLGKMNDLELAQFERNLNEF